MTRHPVFFDPSKKRAAVLRVVSLAVAVVSTALLAVFVASVLVLPNVPGLPLQSAHHRTPLAGADEIAQRKELLPAARQLAEARAVPKGRPGRTAPAPATIPVVSPTQRSAGASRSDCNPLTIGFYVTWDDSSYASLEKALPKLDWVVPSWLELVGKELELKSSLDQKSLDLIHRVKPATTVLPMLQNATDGKWDGPGLARLLADPVKRQARLDSLVAFIAANSLQGLVVDFEEVPTEAHANLLAFLHEMRAAFKLHGWLVAIAVPFDDFDWNYRRYAETTDYQILMAYDEHFEEGESGSIASQSWFVDNLTRRMKELDPRAHHRRHRQLRLRLVRQARHAGHDVPGDGARGA